jgi:hypothetical protein
MALADDAPTVFLDTSALLAVFDESDQWHERATNYWKTDIIQSLPRPRVVLTDFIIDEAATRIRRDVSHQKAVEAVNLLLEMKRRGAFEILAIDEVRFNAAWKIFVQYSDQDFSFTDCTSFVVCEELKVTRAFAFDSHFQTYRITTAPL